MKPCFHSIAITKVLETGGDPGELPPGACSDAGDFDPLYQYGLCKDCLVQRFELLRKAKVLA